MIYIVTRDRLASLRKVIPHWLAQGLPITLVVEQAEVALHEELVAGTPINLLANEDNIGMGAVRAFVFAHAHARGQRAIIMADDDCYPTGDVKLLLEFAIKNASRALGIGAVKSSYGHFIGNEALGLNAPFLHTGSVGRQLAAWNVPGVIACGNSDPALDVAFEDNELCLRGIARRLPWYLHSGVVAKNTNKRFSPGGIMTLAGGADARAAGIDRCHKYVYQKHPGLVSRPGGPFRFFWTKALVAAYNDDWRPYLHKGVMP